MGNCAYCRWNISTISYFLTVSFSSLNTANCNFFNHSLPQRFLLNQIIGLNLNLWKRERISTCRLDIYNSDFFIFDYLYMFIFIYIGHKELSMSCPQFISLFSPLPPSVLSDSDSNITLESMVKEFWEIEMALIHNRKSRRLCQQYSIGGLSGRNDR